MAISFAALPKVSLHEHLDGCVRLETVLELSQAEGLPLPADTVETLGAWIAERSNGGSLERYLESFTLTGGVMQTAAGIHRVAYEYVLDQAADGVVHAEVRWAPELSVQRGLALEEALEAASAGIADATKTLRSAGTDIEVTQIISAMRQSDRVEEVAGLALRYRDTGIVAFDIAGPEAGFPPSLFAATFDRLRAEWMPVTIHAGEGDGLASVQSALRDGHALRLGHGVRLAEDLARTEDGWRLGRTAEWVRDRGVALETSPTSNLHTGVFAQWGPTMADHPFARLYELGFAVTVNTDNKLMSGTTLSNELSVLSDTFGYGLDDLEVFQLTAAGALFSDPATRARVAARIRAGFDIARASD